MYARTDYPPSADELHVPQNYGGNALTSEAAASAGADDVDEEVCPAVADAEAQPCAAHNPWECPPPKEESPPPRPPRKELFGLSSLLGKLPFGDMLGRLPLFGRPCDGADARHGVFDNSEDLLLIGLAAFLFFSPHGDRECAVLLLALVFLT